MLIHSFTTLPMAATAFSARYVRRSRHCTLLCDLGRCVHFGVLAMVIVLSTEWLLYSAPCDRPPRRRMACSGITVIK